MGIGLVPYSPALSPGKWSAEAWVNTTLLNVNQAAVSLSFTNGGWRRAVGQRVVVRRQHGRDLGEQWQRQHGRSDYSGSMELCGDKLRRELRSPLDSERECEDGRVHSGLVPLWANWAQFIIGAQGVSPTSLAGAFFDGQVDEVAVYPRLLTGVEISGHYAARGTVLVPVTFTTPLLSQTVTTGKSVSFSTTALGTTPISLLGPMAQKLIQNATNATYTYPSTALGDTGTYTLWGTNSGSTNSISASLTVISPVAYANVTNSLVLHLSLRASTTDLSGRSNGTASTTTAPVFCPRHNWDSSAPIYDHHALSDKRGSRHRLQLCQSGNAGFGPAPDLQLAPPRASVSACGSNNRLDLWRETCRSSGTRPTPTTTLAGFWLQVTRTAVGSGI